MKLKFELANKEKTNGAGMKPAISLICRIEWCQKENE